MSLLLPETARPAELPGNSVRGNRAALASVPTIDATTAQRYEVKFWASERQATEMLNISQHHLELDPFCRGGPQRNVSLYLDSPLRSFFELHVTGVPSRFKLRVRTYDEPDGPAFLEVKRRVKSVTSKLRTVVPRALARQLLSGDRDATAALPPTHDLTEFLYLQQRYLAEPVLLVGARRMALRSVGDGGRFRMTLDRDIQYQPSRGDDLTGRARGWTPVDLSTRTGNDGLRVLFEMKFVDASPGWLAPAIEQVGLRPTSYSKYVACMSQYLQDQVVEGTGPLPAGPGEDEDGE